MCSVTATPKASHRGSPIQLVLDLLGADEVVTSAVLLNRLENRGLSRNYARQVLKRAADSPLIWRSNQLVLESGGRIFCRRAFWGQPTFHTAIVKILGMERRGLHRVLLATQDGVTLRSNLQKLLASPLESRDSHPYPLLENEVAALSDTGAVRWEARGTATERLCDFRLIGTAKSAQAARAQWAERAIAAKLTSVLANHLRRMNFLTWGSMPPVMQGGFVAFNNFAFDHVGFSRIGPLLRFTDKAKQPSPTPVLFEIHAQACPAYAIEGFLDRMRRAGMNPTMRLPLVGVVAAPSFPKESWKLAKNEGLITVDFREMFGEEALTAMAIVEQLLLQVGNEPESISDEGLAQLGRALQQAVGSPIVSDLRGMGFETLTGLILASKGWQGIELNQLYPFGKATDTSDVSRELDVFGTKSGNDEIYAIECKAERSTKLLDRNYLSRFFTQTIPAMLSAKFHQGRQPRKVIAQIWTTGSVNEELRQLVREMPVSANIEASLLDRAQVREMITPNLSHASQFLDTIASSPHDLSHVLLPSTGLGYSSVLASVADQSLSRAVERTARLRLPP